MPEIILTGCTPEPLMSYLKTLGVFRLVTEQADGDARLSWAGAIARLHSRFEREALGEFFLSQYCPTPIVAPWNGGSGFYGGGEEPLVAIANSKVDRLLLYRETIARIRGFVPDSKPRDEQKESLLIRCRTELPDEIVPWLDVCFVLGEDGPSYFPLLGTGGNDGRLDFTNNFMQRLTDVLPFPANAAPTEDSRQWLSAALFADTLIEQGKTAIGQFNPGGVGGANGTQGKFEASSRVNPWDFVLMIEGVLLFAGAVARRLGVNAVYRSVFPFSVESVAVGYGSATASEETNDGSRSELWLPLWDEPVSFAEAKHLFSEGRAQLGRHQARNAVEFALAVNLLGISRGVKSFARYGFLKRNGLAFLAAPLGRVKVTVRPNARLLDDPPLVAWLDHLRSACRDKEKTPARYQTALRQIDRAMFEFANRSEQGNDPKYLLEVLCALGRAGRTLANGLAFCNDKHLRPLQGLSPRWLIDAAPRGEEGREFRLAATLASIMAEPRTDLGPLRTHLEPVEQKGQWTNWSPGSTSAVWTGKGLADNLAAVLLRRLLDSEKAGVKGCSLRARVFAPLADVVAFIERQTDDEKLMDLLWALTALKWTADDFRQAEFQKQRADVFRTQQTTLAPTAFGLIRLVLTPVKLIIDQSPIHGQTEPHWRVAGKNELADFVTTPSAAPFQQLARRKLDEAETLAARRLWSDRIVPFGWGNRHRRQSRYNTGLAIVPERLLAACLFPLSPKSVTRLARQVLNPPAVVS
jgi:CRISPR-associated protein Csx17